MKFLHFVGLATLLASTAISAPADTAPAQEGSLAAPENTTLASNGVTAAKTYDLGALKNLFVDLYDQNDPIWADTSQTMYDVFKKKIQLTNEVRRKLRSNLSRLAANNLIFAKELERNVAAMAALASPAGTAYKGITPDEVSYVYTIGIMAQLYGDQMRWIIADRHAAATIRPFLWKFASREVLQGQANAKRTMAPFQKLLASCQASKRKASPNDAYNYDMAIQQITWMTANGGRWYNYIYTPPPTQQA